MDIVEPFLKPIHSNQNILFTTHCYCKLTRAIETSRATITHVAKLFKDHCLIHYGFQTYFSTDNESQHVNAFFANMYALFAVENYTIMAYYLQTSGKVEQLEKTILTRIWSYVV